MAFPQSEWLYCSGSLAYDQASTSTAAAERKGVDSKTANASSVRLFPNPAGQTAHLQWQVQQPGTTQVELRNALGKLVWHQVRATSAGVQRTEIPVSYLPQGFYYVTVDSEGRRPSTHRLMVF